MSGYLLFGKKEGWEGSFLVNISSYDYRIICLVLACMIYAAFGSPTPDFIGGAEVFIAVLLALSIGIGRVYDVFFKKDKLRFWKSAAYVFLIYGMSVPLIVAVLSGHDIGMILRDIIPFLFWFLPLFLLPVLRVKPRYFRNILFSALIIGLLFSLRSLVMRFSGGGGELLYLENMPTVLFACLFMIGVAMSFIMRGLTLKNVIVFAALIILSLFPIAVMSLTLQRASLGAVVIYIALLMGYFFYKAPARSMVLLIIGMLTIFIINISFSDIFLSLWEKTQRVGLNMRIQEAKAVWEVISVNPPSFLFGIGWGGQFNSPAVGGLSVNFTHNFFTTLLLKTGVVGVISCIAYIAGLLERLSRVIIKNPVLGLAIVAPVLIDLTLYASFKSLDFGLILLMISGALVYLRQPCLWHSESLQHY